ncbi:MAG TPA: hypothetical protein VJO35_18620 [Terriglobales bacterium]|nr:hypothetical protein [Terriglobales bacterium]
MGRHLDLIRRSALPSHQMMTAAKGALHVPVEEMVEILVHLADNNKIFGEQARLTLAGWDEKSAKTIVSNPATPKEVLDYWVSPRNLRQILFPLLLENPSVSATKLGHVGSTLKGEWIDLMLASPRVRGTRGILQDISTNKELSRAQTARLQELITGKSVAAAAVEPAPAPPVTPATVPPSNGTEPAPATETGAAGTQAEALPGEFDSTSDPETDKALAAFMSEHASEIAAEGEKAFEPLAETQEEQPEEQIAAAAASAPAAAATTAKSGAAVKLALKKAVAAEEEKRGSVLQKISKLDIKGRIQLGMKGSKEERSILIRDGTKIVALAVLDSPKITDGEVEKFASQKNVLEAVLRAIPMKRRFAKNYAVVRNLTFNPRTPLDVALGLMKNLLVQDLRNLSGNKEVPDTIRKLALRMFKQKMETAKKN